MPKNPLRLAIFDEKASKILFRMNEGKGVFVNMNRPMTIMKIATRIWIGVKYWMMIPPRVEAIIPRINNIVIMPNVAMIPLENASFNDLFDPIP